MIQLLQIIITSCHQLVYLWWIYGKQIYFNMVWYWNEFCKNANIWYTCFSWCSLIFKTRHNFANLFLKAHFCWSWTRALFSELKVAAHLNVCRRSELKVAAHVCGRSEFCSLLRTAYLILIFSVTIKVIFYFYINYFRK